MRLHSQQRRVWKVTYGTFRQLRKRLPIEDVNRGAYRATAVVADAHGVPFNEGGRLLVARTAMALRIATGAQLF